MGGVAHVEHERLRQPYADASPIDGAHHQLGHRQGEHAVPGLSPSCFDRAGLRQVTHVGARGKPPPSPGDDDSADLLVGNRVLQAVVVSRCHPRYEGIETLGTVEGHQGDPIDDFIKHHVFGHLPQTSASPTTQLRSR